MTKTNLLLVLTGVLSIPALAQDNVRLRKGDPLVGSVKSADYAGLSFQPSKGAVQTIAWRDVVAIEYAGVTGLGKAITEINSGSFKEAEAQLEALKGDAKVKGPARQDVLYFSALCKQRQGQFDEALAGYRDYIKEFPKGRFLRAVGDGILACHAGKNDVAGAGKTLDELFNAVRTAGETAFQGDEAILKGIQLEEQKKYSDARFQYGLAEKAAGAAPAVSQEARLGIARCLQREGKGAEADQYCRKLVAEDAPNFILAGAWNGIGEVLRDEGKKKRDSEKLLDALYAFLRGVVQYGPVPGEPTSEHMRALQGSSECFRFLAELETNADRKKLFNERARERAEQLKREYGR